MKLTIDVYKIGARLTLLAALINLAMAIFDLDYDFSFFVRFFTFFTYLILMYIVSKSTSIVSLPSRNLFFVIIIILAVIYNPIIPVHLGSSTPWFYLNLFNALSFFVFSYRLSSQKTSA